MAISIETAVQRSAHPNPSGKADRVGATREALNSYLKPCAKLRKNAVPPESITRKIPHQLL
jgi:hypothetical protein